MRDTRRAVRRAVAGSGTVTGSALWALLGALALALVAAAPAAGQGKSETKRLQGMLQGYDAEASTITVRASGRDVVLNVKNEGSVLKRTTATINAKPTKVSELPEGSPVIVYWVPDPNEEGEKFARKVDAPNVPEELMDAME